ncbi:hypothetical protein Bca101_003766 [Brassica carinata]|uniref:Zinc finger GRF-type domain-containing protein n=1 Tax=Brassica oleracea var. oleracea TaxID=109376 RepID=A0A0D3BA65_BRAOL
MDLKSGSSSNSRNIGYYGGRKLCACRLPAKIFTAWTDKNPGRKFFGCELYKVKIEKMILGCFSSNGMGCNQLPSQPLLVLHHLLPLELVVELKLLPPTELPH